jgi:hypothetical protein
MNITNARTTARPKLSLRYGAIHAQALEGGRPKAAILPTIELRRLVATMVD